MGWPLGVVDVGWGEVGEEGTEGCGEGGEGKEGAGKEEEGAWHGEGKMVNGYRNV